MGAYSTKNLALDLSNNYYDEALPCPSFPGIYTSILSYIVKTYRIWFKQPSGLMVKLI